MVDLVECVSFILKKKQKVLLEQRSINKKTDAGKVTIPGGHIEMGESHKQALQREVREELGIKADNFTYICSLVNRVEEQQLVHYYSVDDWDGDIQCSEADLLMWSNTESQFIPHRRTDKIALMELENSGR